MKKHVVDFFRFLDKKEGVKVPLKVKLLNPRLFTITKDDLNYNGNLDLSGAKIQKLPDGLTVDGSLNLNGTNISSLPKRLRISGHLYLFKTPLANEYSLIEIRAAIEDGGGYLNGRVHND